MFFKKIVPAALSLLMISGSMVSAMAVQDNTQEVGAYTNSTSSYATYSGNDLGASYSKTSTTFKVWAPSASAVKLNLYKTGSDSEAGAGKISETNMSKDSSTGVWSVTAQGDLNGRYYTYSVTVNGSTKETQDVYSKAVGVNGNRSMVIDMSSTDPLGWSNDQHMLVDHQTDAVIWEVQVRDFSISQSSGVSSGHRGKYLAFTESGTKLNGTEDISTCVDYLVEQGVNYVHLNPVYDYGSVDETKLSTPQYNWGYDPVNYNVPEGSYSTDPYKGEVRIKEFKQMVQALHDRGIGVIMDVVYNHTYKTDSCFERTVPGYYYRMNGSTFLDGSGCGNVTASDKTMFRKYMVDSVKYWAEEYHIDGFRFDLMGCHDITTMNQIRSSLDSIDKRILVYGEPWMADWNGGNGISNSQACIMDNASSVSERVGMFSDKIRNALKGGTDDATKGYIQGDTTKNYDIKAGMMGGTSTMWGKWSRQPSQCVTYDSAHDNLTLWDKILKSNSSTDYNGTNSTFLAQNKLSAAIVLTSQGIPFYLAGEEFARTKNGNSNSYSSPDSVNQIDWTRVKTYSNLVEYYKGLMAIRSVYSPFRDNTTASANTSYFTDNGSAIGYTILNKTANASKEWGTVAVLTNNTTSAKTVTLGCQDTMPSSWVVVANGDKAGLEKLGTVSGSSISVPARSAMVLVDASTYDRLQISSTKYTVTTKHIDSSTGTVLKETSVQYKEGTSYRTSADEDLLFDYELVNVVGAETGTVTGNVTVSYYYKKDSTPSYNLTVKYTDQSGREISESKTTKYKQGNSYTALPATVSGYELDTTKIPLNITGSISADTTITYVYKTVNTSSKVKVHYYNANNWSSPHLYAYDESSGTAELLSGAWPGQAMTAEGNNWYTYPEINKTTAQVMFTNGAATNAQQEPGANQPGYVVSGEVWLQNGKTLYGSRVVVSYVDTNGKKLADDVTVTGEKISDGDSYTTTGISGYGDPVAVIGGASGSWSQNIKNVIYVYKAKTEPVEEYVLGDINGDSESDLIDAVIIQKYLAGISTLSDKQTRNGDINGDGEADLLDAVIIQKYLAGLNTGYMVGQIIRAS